MERMRDLTDHEFRELFPARSLTWRRVARGRVYRSQEIEGRGYALIQSPKHQGQRGIFSVWVKENLRWRRLSCWIQYLAGAKDFALEHHLGWVDGYSAERVLEKAYYEKKTRDNIGIEDRMQTWIETYLGPEETWELFGLLLDQVIDGYLFRKLGRKQ